MKHPAGLGHHLGRETINFVDYLRQSGAGSAALLAAGLVYTCVVGWMNLNAPLGLDLTPLYLLGSAAVGWIAGGRMALVVVALSALFLGWEGSRGGAGTTAGWVFYANLLVRVAGLAGAGWMAGVAGRLARQLEKAVKDRTASLQQEVEEHRQTAMRWREMAQLFDQLTQNITEAFWVAEPGRARFNYLSPGFERIWGRSRREFYLDPQLWFEAVCETDRDRIAQLARAGQGHGAYDEDYRVVQPDGKIRWVHDRSFTVKDEGQRIYRLVGIAEDITDRKHEEQLRRIQRDCAAALSQTSDLYTPLKVLAESLAQMDGVDYCAVYLVSPSSPDWELLAACGLSSPFLQRVRHIEGPLTEACLEQNWRAEPARPKSRPAEGSAVDDWGRLRALKVALLRNQQEVLGAVCLASRRLDEIPGRILAGLETIAAQVGGAIVRIRLEQQILEISDREQSRLGQDIHDGLCQQIIGAAFAANALEKSLTAQGRPEAASARGVCQVLDEAMTESRRVTRGLYPLRLRTEGLVPALEELAAAVSRRFNLACRCHASDGEIQFNNIQAIHLYRIAQEAVNNAVKHSGGGVIDIQLIKTEGATELRIGDNGRGISAEDRRGAGMGLHIMEHRARSIGAEFHLQTGTGGTTVICRMRPDAA